MNHADGPEQIQVDISKLHPDASQPRRHFKGERIESLKSDIIQNGLKTPLDICYLPDGRKGAFLIIDGHRRYYAIQEIPAFGPIRCSLFPYTEQREIDKHRASVHFQREPWNPVERARFLGYYKETYNLTVEALAEEFKVTHATIVNWIAPLRDVAVLESLEKEEITFTQALHLSRIDDAETRENALRLAKRDSSDDKHKTSEETKAIVNSLQNPELTVEESDTADEESASHHIDPSATDSETPTSELPVDEEGGETTIEDIDSGLKTSMSPSETEITVEGADSDTDGPPTETIEDPHATAPQTPSIMQRAFEGPPEREAEPEDRQPAVSESGDEPPLETEENEKKSELKIVRFVTRMQNIGVAVDSHMRDDELEMMDDSCYRKLLKNYEEAVSSIECYRDFLEGRKLNGSVAYNRATRLHNALREFNVHTVTDVKEAQDLRSIIIQTKQKLTSDINIADNIIKQNSGHDGQEMIGKW